MQEPLLFPPSPAGMRRAPSAFAAPCLASSRIFVVARGAAGCVRVMSSAEPIIDFRFRSVQ